MQQTLVSALRFFYVNIGQLDPKTACMYSYQYFYTSKSIIRKVFLKKVRILKFKFPSSIHTVQKKPPALVCFLPCATLLASEAGCPVSSSWPAEGVR